ncbi:hypothetical protein HDU98_010474 [Podochytrium sp. JEL0797]|nr:hypothetical protein HDU98_010474 [Podochytrium sp. JEL0797]
MADLRKTCADVLREDIKAARFEPEEFAWIPIEWHSLVHNLPSVDARMQLVTLPTTPIFRQINNDKIADVLYFFSSFHGAQVVQTVAKVLNQQYAKFMRENPEFDGPVCILAHSLGGAITYDLLANQDIAVDFPDTESDGPESVTSNPSKGKEPASKSNASCRTHYEITYPKLNFKPDMLITLGAQVAAVMIMRGQSPSTYALPPDILYHNVFHLYDPLAYRIEPLIDSRYAEISPQLIQRPSSLTKGFNLAYYHSLSQLFTSYLPSLPQMPNDLNLQSMLPAVGMSFLPDLGGFASGPTTLAMSKSFSDVRKAMVEGMYSFAGAASGLFDEMQEGRKRGHETVGELEDESEQRPKHKRRRIEEGAVVEGGSSSGVAADGMGKFGRKIAKPRTLRKKASMTEAKEPLSVEVASTEPLSKQRENLDPNFISPTALADGVMEKIRSSFRRVSAAFTLFDEDETSDSESPVPGLVGIARYEETSTVFTQSRSQSPVRYNSSPKPIQPHRMPSQEDVAMVLTEELAAAAERRLKRPTTRAARDPSPARQSTPPGEQADESNDEEENALPLKERLDYFVTETVMENTVHQYLIGMRAHFSYWRNHDMMYHILSNLLALKKEQSEKE